MIPPDAVAGGDGSTRAGRLLLAVLREEGPAVDRLARGDDWDGFLTLARIRGLAPWIAGLLHGSLAAVRPSVPAAVLAHLEEIRRRTSYDNLLLMTSLRPLLTELGERGIVPIVLKGAALLDRVYEDPGTRQLTDLDLVVPPGRAGETIRILGRHGLSPIESDQRAARRKGFAGKDAAAPPVDIHWDLFQAHRFRADMQGVWSRSIRWELEGVPVRRLAPEDEFLYLSLHYASHYFGITLKWLVDLRELLRHDPPRPGALAERAGAWRGRCALHFALSYLRRVWPDQPFVDEYERLAGRPSWRNRLIAPFLSDDPLLLVRDLRRGLPRLLLGLLFVDRPADMIRLGRVTLLSGDDGHAHPPAGT